MHSWPQIFQALCVLQLSLTTVGRGVGMQLKLAATAIEVHATASG